jgi:hypothetical protein
LPEQADPTDQFFDATAVSSLAEVLADYAGGLTSVPPAHLPLWLPGLTVPHGWDAGTANDQPVTRLLLRRLRGHNRWDGCEVINLYRVPAAVPQTLVLDNADRTLRDSCAEAIHTHRIETPPRYGTIAARASGRVRVGPDLVHSQYSYYAVNTAAGGALIEQVLIVRHDAQPLLSNEVAALTDNLYRALLASIELAPTPPGLQNAALGSSAWDPRKPPLPSSEIPSGPPETGSKWRAMSTIRVNFLPEFYYGDDAVLLTLDGGGVDELHGALSDAAQRGSSRLEHNGVTHDFRIEPGRADVELDCAYVVWRLDRAKATEIIDDLAALSSNDGVGQVASGHFYVDLSTPAKTLVVSRDEYVDVVYPWESPP